MLALQSNRLSGTIPYMPSLQVLNLASNQVRRFSAMPATLQFLYLANNSLTGDLSQLWNLTTSYMELKLLDLAYNNLSGSLPQDMRMLPNLSILNISNNALVGTLPSGWSRLKTMADLRLDNNHFTGKLPAT